MFGDVIQEVLETYDAFAGPTQTIVATLPAETVAGSLLVGRYFTGSPEAEIDSAGYAVDAELLNVTQFDIGFITAKTSPGGSQALQITGSQAQEAILRFQEIEGPFEETPLDQSVVGDKTTGTTEQSTGTTADTSQADEFAVALVTQNTTTGNPANLAATNGFGNLMLDKGGDPPGTNGTKSIAHADKVLTAVGPVETTISGLTTSIHMGAVATYKKAAGPPEPEPECDVTITITICIKGGNVTVEVG